MMNEWDKPRQEIARRTNIEMRETFLSDAGVGESILRGRRKSMNDANLFQLRQGWSPISWLREPGLKFEISQLSMMALGQNALDSKIDHMLVDATMDVFIDNHEDALELLIKEAVLGADDNA